MIFFFKFEKIFGPNIQDVLIQITFFEHSLLLMNIQHIIYCYYLYYMPDIQYVLSILFEFIIPHQHILHGYKVDIPIFGIHNTILCYPLFFRFFFQFFPVHKCLVSFHNKTKKIGRLPLRCCPNSVLCIVPMERYKEHYKKYRLEF